MRKWVRGGGRVGRSFLSVVLDEQVPAVVLDFLVQLGLDIGVSGNVVIGLSVHEVSGSLGGVGELNLGGDDQTLDGAMGSLKLGNLYRG